VKLFVWLMNRGSNGIPLDSLSRNHNEAMLLGAPLSRSGFSSAVTGHRNTLVSLTERIRFLSAHEGLHLYRNCIFIPKWLYLIRTSSGWDDFTRCPLRALDGIQSETLSEILNISLTDRAWMVASLPVRWGGHWGSWS